MCAPISALNLGAKLGGAATKDRNEAASFVPQEPGVQPSNPQISAEGESNFNAGNGYGQSRAQLPPKLPPMWHHAW